MEGIWKALATPILASSIASAPILAFVVDEPLMAQMLSQQKSGQPALAPVAESSNQAGGANTPSGREISGFSELEQAALTLLAMIECKGKGGPKHKMDVLNRDRELARRVAAMDKMQAYIRLLLSRMGRVETCKMLSENGLIERPAEQTPTDSAEALKRQELLDKFSAASEQLNARLAASLTFENALAYTAARANLFKALIKLTIDSGAAVTARMVSQQSCPSDSEAALLLSTNMTDVFLENDITRKHRVDRGTPNGEFLYKNYSLYVLTAQKMYIAIYFQVADAALKANCLSLADKSYRSIVQIADSETDMRRAQIGVDDVRAKQRSP